MNGGVLHCIEVLSIPELRAAIAGYRLFGLSDAADVLKAATRVPPDQAEEEESKLDAAYAKAVPDDKDLAALIERALPPDRAASDELAGDSAIAAAINAFVKASTDSVILSSVPGKTQQQHRAHRRKESAVKELLRHWDVGGHDALIRLLTHSDDAVRVSAASYLAGSDPDRAIPVLEEMDKVGGPAGMSAHMMLFVIKNMDFKDPLTHLRTASGGEPRRRGIQRRPRGPEIPTSF